MSKDIFKRNVVSHAHRVRVERKLGIHLLSNLWSKMIHLGLRSTDDQIKQSSFTDVPLAPIDFEFSGALEGGDVADDAEGPKPCITADTVAPHLSLAPKLPRDTQAAAA